MEHPPEVWPFPPVTPCIDLVCMGVIHGPHCEERILKNLMHSIRMYMGT